MKPHAKLIRQLNQVNVFAISPTRCKHKQGRQHNGDQCGWQFSIDFPNEEHDRNAQSTDDSSIDVNIDDAFPKAWKYIKEVSLKGQLETQKFSSLGADDQYTDTSQKPYQDWVGDVFCQNTEFE